MKSHERLAQRYRICFQKSLIPCSFCTLFLKRKLIGEPKGWTKSTSCYVGRNRRCNKGKNLVSGVRVVMCMEIGVCDDQPVCVRACVVRRGSVGVRNYRTTYITILTFH